MSHAKSRHTYREISLRGQTWLYLIGRSNVSIRTPDGKRVVVSLQALTGIQDIDRARWKRTLEVTPGQIQAYIENNLI